MLSRISRSFLPIVSKVKPYKVPCRFFSKTKLDISKVPSLDEFLRQQGPAHNSAIGEESVDYLINSNVKREEGLKKQANNVFIETYGCQMNENDTEIVASILKNSGFTITKDISDAQVVLINTCAIRENAESKVWNRLSELRVMKKKMKNEQFIIGVLGCMAERLKEQLVEKNKAVDIVVGPDAYRDLPRLIHAVDADTSQYGINVQLSYEETYADVVPVRSNPDSSSAYISIMRGCNNMCAFCIVPFTRGRERSRPIESILEEVQGLKDQGVKEIILLGQNVNSYHDTMDATTAADHENSKGFNEMYKLRHGAGARFDVLLQKCAEMAPEVRFRFTSPHPKDFPERVLDVINSYPNLSKSIHLPAQSGSTSMLKRMRRNHTREAYLELVDQIRVKIPEMTFSTDMICGFCGETEEEFQDTVSLLEHMKYEQAFLFAYSMREKTHAHRNYVDDVPAQVKQERLERMIESFRRNQGIATQKDVGRYHIMLVEGAGKMPGQWRGRTDTNKTAVVDTSVGILERIPVDLQEKIRNKEINSSVLNDEIKRIQESQGVLQIQKGDYIVVKVDRATTKTLLCTPVAKTSISDFSFYTKNRPYFTLNA